MAAMIALRSSSLKYQRIKFFKSTSQIPSLNFLTHCSDLDDTRKEKYKQDWLQLNNKTHKIFLKKHFSTNNIKNYKQNSNENMRKINKNDKTLGISTLITHLEAGRDDDNDLIRQWLLKTRSESTINIDNSFHDLLHSIDLMENNSELFNKVVSSLSFGDTLRSKIMRCGRIIKRARGRDNIGTLAQRIVSDSLDNHDDGDNDREDQISEYGKYNGNKLISRLVGWCEEKSDESIDQRQNTQNTRVRSKPHKQIVPYVNQSGYFDDLMYIYCQAGYIFDAIGLWKIFIEDFNYKPHRASTSGLIRLLCYQILDEGLIDHRNYEDYDVVGDNALKKLKGILKLIKLTRNDVSGASRNGTSSHGIEVLKNPVSKALDMLIRGIIDENEIVEDRNEHSADVSLLKLEEILNLIDLFDEINIDVKRKSYTALLKLCNQVGNGSDVCFKVQDIFNMIENKNSSTNIFNIIKDRSFGSKTIAIATNDVVGSPQVSARVRKGYAKKQANSTDEFYPPTRHDYCLYISALHKAKLRQESQVKTDSGEHDVDYEMKISQVCEEMSDYLPLTDTFLIGKAKLGDIDSLNGALMIKELSGEALSMRLVTKLMVDLVSYASTNMTDNDEENPLEIVNPHLNLAWKLWHEFQDCSGSSDPDLRMFNVALTVASKMRSVERLDDLLFKLTCTPISEVSTEQESQMLNKDENKDKTMFLKPDLFTYNILIDAYGRCNHLYKALELFDEMKHECVKPDVVTYNSLAKAYVLQNRLDDAVNIIKLAEKEGITANYITFRTLCHAFGDSNAMLNELHEMESNINHNMVSAAAAGAASEQISAGMQNKIGPNISNYDMLLKNATVWNQTSDTCNLELDLHLLNVSEAKTKLVQELEYLHSFYKEENKTSNIKDGDDYDGEDIYSKESENNEDTEDDDNDSKQATSDVKTSLPDLVLITGVGKNSLKNKNKSVMKYAMIDYLNSEGIVFHEESGNPGRLIVPSQSLKIFFEKFRIRNMHTSYSNYLSLRYMVLPSILASVFILPKLTEFYSSF